MAAIERTEDLAAYSNLRQLGDQAAQEGRLEDAIGHLHEAWDWARDEGDAALADRAYCNLSSVLIAARRSAKDVVAPLREILTRNTDRVTCLLAAYNIAREYEFRKENKKSLFYARIALNFAENGEGIEPTWHSACHNQIANCMVADSYFDEAIAEYAKSLEFLDSSPTVRTGVAEGNLGYCHVVRGRHREGFTLLVRSLRILRRLGTEHERMIAHLDLCFAHLEIGRHRWARRHGEQALRLAQRLGDQETLKNSLYLLGETANLLGDEDEAVAYFTRLKSHFPDTPFLVDFLMAIDVRKMINLRA